MANYHECAIWEATDPEAIGVGLGDTGSGLLGNRPAGPPRICISLGMKRIDWPPGEEPSTDYDWISPTPATAKRLYELLKFVNVEELAQ